jgi:TPP-dependent pyruvate/acetoin dehydrogenase alpha subunit
MKTSMQELDELFASIDERIGKQVVLQVELESEIPVYTTRLQRAATQDAEITYRKSLNEKKDALQNCIHTLRKLRIMQRNTLTDKRHLIESEMRRGLSLKSREENAQELQQINDKIELLNKLIV